MPWIELHFHLLPGVDDGPRDMDESVELAAAAVRDGTGTVVVTPHIHHDVITDPSEIPERTRELAAALARAGVKLNVEPGGELAHDMVDCLSDRQLELIAHGPAGRRWLLLEAPFSGLDASYTAAADELRERGFAVVVAHPERAKPTAQTGVVLHHELRSGSVLQLNCWSLTGRNGEQARRSALGLLHSPRVVIASDAHGVRRPPAMGRGLDAARAAGYRKPERLAADAPAGLLAQGLVVTQANLR
jgi:protein-tyrosine phosphatase